MQYNFPLENMLHSGWSFTIQEVLANMCIII